MSNLIDLQGITHSYGRVEVLNDINFSISSGHIIGLLGPNGCGKTTLMKIIAGLIADYKGTVKISGHPVGPESKAIISYLPDKTYFPDWMRVKDCIKIFRDFYQDFNEERAWELIEKFKIPKNQINRQMSKGTQEKLQLIMVMSRRAKLFLLDEPLGGIDPAARASMLEIIMSGCDENTSLILSTHLIHDVERVFDHVLFIKNTRVLVNSDVDTLRTQTGKSLEEHFKEVYTC